MSTQPLSPARHADRSASIATPGLALLLALRFRLLRNRVRQLTDQSPVQLLMIIVFLATIWGGLYVIFDNVFVFLRRHEDEAVIAIPYLFHMFFVAMTIMLAFSTAVLVYGGLFGREEPAFLLTAPNAPRNVVAIMFIEALFFASWSLVLLGLPLMLAIGHVQGLPWHFYPTFVVAFLGFVPIPGALGLLAALAVALYLPRIARKSVLYAGGVLFLLIIVWWGRLWAISSTEVTAEWVDNMLAELRPMRAALLPSSWVAKAIQFSIQNKPADAVFYLAITLTTAAFASWWSHLIVARKLQPAYGRAQAAPNRLRPYSGWASQQLTRVVFFYLPVRMRVLILKDVRNFIRDPVQWSQLAILLGLLSLYLFYLPRSRPEGFNLRWQALICFLNYGAITLILSTFTSRFVYPMISLEGNQSWLIGLWPLGRSRVLWAKLFFSLTITAAAAVGVAFLSIRALKLPLLMAAVQMSTTLASCVGLCGLAVGLGARMPSYFESNASRIASGLGGTVNLIASVGLVALSVALFGVICYLMVESGTLERFSVACAIAFCAQIFLNVLIAGFALKLGLDRFRTQEF